jgi:cell division protein FtsW
MNFKTKYIKGDGVIWMVTFLLAILSILTVYSSIATLAYKYKSGNTVYYLLKHVFILVVGFVMMTFVQNINYKYFSRLSQLTLIIAVPLLLLTLLTGANINEASRWLVIPIINQTFQTSDLAKLALIMYLARVLAKKQEVITDFKEAFLPLIIPVVIVCALILPANFSTAAMLFAISLFIMFMGRVPLKFIITTIGVGLAGILLVFAIASVSPKLFPRFATWKKRIESFQKGESESNYQAEQAKIAIAGGGIKGKGPGKSTQRNFLPHPYSDFIFAIIVEEYGTIGALIVVLLYLVFLYRGVRIASRAERTFGSLLAIGLTFSIAFQAFINMGVAVGVFPVTGQPLPLVSMGGTSIWFTCITIGVVLSVSNTGLRNSKLKAK